MLAWLGLGIATVLGLMLGKKGSPVPGEAPGISWGGGTEAWRLFFMPMSVATGVPIQFALAWTEKESGGNPCAVGRLTALGPDGTYQEMGIGQFYNPDDLKRFGVTGKSLRVYCVPGTQRCSRQLTPTEMAQQAHLLYQLIQYCRDTADTAMRKNGVRGWSERDTYKLTKLVHGLPGLVKSGLALVTIALKRPPRDWSEFKSAILGGVKMDAGTERYRAQFARTFANAESTANAIPAAPDSGKSMV